MGPEAGLKKRILKELIKIPKSFWESIQQRSVRGTSDIVGTVQGVSYRIEVKEKFKAKLEDREWLQMHYLSRHAQAGGTSILMHGRNWQRQIEWIRRRHGVSD